MAAGEILSRGRVSGTGYRRNGGGPEHLPEVYPFSLENFRIEGKARAYVGSYMTNEEPLLEKPEWL
jgi:hypothetical protein